MRKILVCWTLSIASLTALLLLWNVNYFNPITALVFYAFLILISISLLLSFKYILKMNDSTFRKLILSITSLWVSLLIVDFFLRFATKKYSTYPETNFFTYESIYESLEGPWFLTRRPNTDILFKTPEYIFSRKTNSLGLSDKEFKMGKDANEFRIIALGDSFTEGMGTTPDNTWPKNVERILSNKYPNKLITVYNCGVTGSDPMFEYMLFKEKLLEYRPDHVVIALNFSDVDDIIIRGGMERFKDDGRVRFNDPPRWEKIYATSFVFRVIMRDLLHYSWILVDEDDYKEKQLYALGEINKIVDKFKQLSAENNFKFLIVLHPFQPEVEKRRYTSEKFSATLKNNEVDTLDLLEVYLNKNQITQKNANQFYWPLDFHHNTEGYKIMGQNIAEKIIEKNYID